MDPDPHPNLNPEDPYVFGSPGSASGSVSHKYGYVYGTDRMFDQFVTQVSYVTFEYSRFRIFTYFILMVQHLLACLECAA